MIGCSIVLEDVMGEIQISDSETSVAIITSRDELSDVTKKSITRADVILLPEDNFRDSGISAFADETPSFIKYVRDVEPDLKLALAANEGDERTLDLHASEIWMPIIFIGRNVLLPIVITLVSNYIYDRYRTSRQRERNVHMEILVSDEKANKTKKLNYVGDITGLEKFKKIDLNKIFEG